MELKNKTFEMPKAEVIIFNNEDVITTSGDPNELPGMPYFLGDDEY